MIQDRNTELLALDRTRIIHPVRTLTPDLFHTVLAVGANHFAATLLLRQRIRQPDRERAFLGIAEGNLLRRRQGDIEINDTQRGV